MVAAENKTRRPSTVDVTIRYFELFRSCHCTLRRTVASAGSSQASSSPSRHWPVDWLVRQLQSWLQPTTPSKNVRQLPGLRIWQAISHIHGNWPLLWWLCLWATWWLELTRCMRGTDKNSVKLRRKKWRQTQIVCPPRFINYYLLKANLRFIDVQLLRHYCDSLHLILRASCASKT